MPRLMGAFVLLVVLQAAPSLVWAGGDGYDEVDEAAGAGTIFYGAARDTRGVGVAGVEVTLRPRSGEAVVLKTNGLGLYRGTMDKAIAPADIEVSFNKPGYTVRDAVRRQAQNKNILVETNSKLQKLAP